LLDIRLVTFITISKIKSYTKAAEILNLTQPAVSQHIKHLEEYYGVNLIKKQGKEIQLSEEGQILYKYAKKLEIIHRDLETELKNKNRIHRVYNLGASMTIGGYVLPYILAKYKKVYDNIDILLQVNNTEEIIEKLLNRKLDLAFIEGNFDKNKFNYKKFKDDELVLAVSPKHSFAKKNAVTLDEVLEDKLILREKGSGTREVFEQKLQSLDYNIESFNPYMELGSISAIKSLVEENLGYTIISKETIKNELKLGSIKIIPIEGIEINREFNFIFLNDYNNDFIKQFIDFSATCYVSGTY
jgi:LysR family transcriptional regulator, transcriptional activator of the cysJI operon